MTADGPVTTNKARDADGKAPQGERLLWIGDRLPDFVLPDPQGALQFFYQTVTGAPTVLVLAANTAMQEQWDEIKQFAELAPALHEAGADLIIVSNDGIESLAMVAKTIPEHAAWLADIKGVVNLGLREATGFAFTGVICFVLDGNQRVVAVRGPEPGQAPWALDRLKGRPASPGQALSVVAPLLLLPAVLEEEDCRSLLDLISAAGPQSGAAALGESPLAERIAKLLLRRIGPDVEKAFAFDDFSFEAMTLKWDEPAAAADVRCARDITDPATQGRSFTMILDLDGGSYAGGEILFPEYGPHHYRPGTGGAIVHSGTMLRDMKAVSAGRRNLLTAILRRS
jgi:hypothetical protein